MEAVDSPPETGDDNVEPAWVVPTEEWPDHRRSRRRAGTPVWAARLARPAGMADPAPAGRAARRRALPDLLGVDALGVMTRLPGPGRLRRTPNGPGGTAQLGHQRRDLGKQLAGQEPERPDALGEPVPGRAVQVHAPGGGLGGL